MKPKRNTIEMEGGLPNLPDEIIFNILSRIPVKPLYRFKSVSKPWLALITDPQFIKSHLDHQSKNAQKQILFENTPCYSDVIMLGLFRAVYLLQLSGTDELCLWNPISRMFQKFSPPEPSGTTLYGLGYDSVSDDYKVVRVTRPYNNDPCVVHLFSSRLSSWKRIG